MSRILSPREGDRGMTNWIVQNSNVFDYRTERGISNEPVHPKLGV